MAEPKDMILPMLREIRDQQNRLEAKVDDGFDTLGTRMDKLEKRFDNLREAVNGESVLGRYAAAEVEDRLEKIERRLDKLEVRT